MARSRQPIEVLLANGKKHLTKAEIAERRASEVRALPGDMDPPEYLTIKQQEEFRTIAKQLQALGIMSETDVDALARYVIANTFYISSVRKLRSREVMGDPELFDSWLKIQERMFKQCRAAASDLGLTISSRCKLVVPSTGKEEKENKFEKFKKRPAVSE